MNSQDNGVTARDAHGNQLPLFVQESKLRRLLSRSPKNAQAWQSLIQLVLTNNQIHEAARLSAMALKHFADDPSFLSRHVHLLLNLGFTDEARPYLNQAASGPGFSLDKRLDMAELEFLRHPGQAGEIFKRCAEQTPEHIRVIAGLESVRSHQRFGHPKIGFLLSAAWHWPIQKSVTQALSSSQTPFYVTTRLWMLKALAPEVIVVSDAAPENIKWIRLTLPSSKIVSTRHGLGVGGKNYGLYAAAATDFICVSSESVKRDLCRDALLTEDRVWVTGFSQMDGLFKAATAQWPPSRPKRVTYAPTFDIQLSSIAVIGGHPVHWIRGQNKNIHLTIRPHPHLFQYQPALMKQWKEICRGEENVLFDDSPYSELSQVLASTDLLISDVSSVALQFMALNRPIICVVDMDQARQSPKYAPEELEWKMHTAAVTVTRKEDLRSAVESALDGVLDPMIKAERTRIQRYLYEGMTDGRAGERIAERLLRLINTRGQNSGQ